MLQVSMDALKRGMPFNTPWSTRSGTRTGKIVVVFERGRAGEDGDFVAIVKWSGDMRPAPPSHIPKSIVRSHSRGCHGGPVEEIARNKDLRELFDLLRRNHGHYAIDILP